MQSPFVSGDLLAPRSDPWIKQSLIHVINDGARLLFIRSLPDDDGETLGETAPDFDSVSGPELADVLLMPRPGTKERNNFDSIKNILAHILGNCGKSDLDSLIEKLCNSSGLLKTFVEESLRMLVAQGMIVASVNDKSTTRIEIRLSSHARIVERRRTYATSFAHNLASQSEQIGNLIGHGPTIGSYREELLRSLIQRHIPQRFHAATGFVDGCPNQLDILIYDQVEYAPLFRVGDLVVVPHASVRAMIEVKSTLSRNELTDALAHLEAARPMRPSGPPIFTGVFAYNGAGSETLFDTIRTFYRLATDDDPLVH